ncbi:2,3-dimethylmalate lyase [Colletotrichum tropicale]|nr:2,3-dimethylmalate lyase [Colletotrichum tropicale]
MSKSIVNSIPYPFKFNPPVVEKKGKPGQTENLTTTLVNVRGKIPSIQASRLRTMMLEAHNDSDKILAHACTYDGLSSRLVEEAGFPMVFLAGYAVASAYGLPDTGYIAMSEMCDKIGETVRQVSVPVMADGDTGYGSPLNVRRTVESFAEAGAAGCGHTKGKSVVSRGEAYARIQAACDARDQGKDIFVLARTDVLVVGWDEALMRAKEFKRIGVDAVFSRPYPTETLCASAVKHCNSLRLQTASEPHSVSRSKDLAELGFSAVAYPWTLVAAKLKSVRETLESLKRSMTVGAPPMVLSFDEVCEGAGFKKYWELEDRYKYDDDGPINVNISSP